AGLAAGVAAVAMVLAAGRSIVAAVPLFGVFALYVAFVLLTSQVFVILRIRFPKVPVRLLTLPVIGLSLLPALGVAVPGLPIRFRLRTDRGSDTGLMTRFHLVRIWRDGSVVFVGLFALLVILPTSLGGARANEIAPITVTQTLTFLLGILAMNWAFSERENLWILLTAAKSPGTYFRGLMLSFAVIGLGMSAAFLVIL